MAAETTLLLSTLRPGDHVVVGDDVYGGTYRLLRDVVARWGVAFDAVDLSDPQALRAALREDTRVVWAETPTNPLLKIVDLAQVAALAHEVGATFVVDNTFATPYPAAPARPRGRRRRALGDEVPERALRPDRRRPGARRRGPRRNGSPSRNAVGAVPGPMDCYLALRGVKTLAVRMDAHCRNAGRVAAFLERRRDVARVYYPGLESHPGHAVASQQMRAFGGMVSFEVGRPRRGGPDRPQHRAVLPRRVARRGREPDRGARRR